MRCDVYTQWQYEFKEKAKGFQSPPVAVAGGSAVVLVVVVQARRRPQEGLAGGQRQGDLGDRFSVSSEL